MKTFIIFSVALMGIFLAWILYEQFYNYEQLPSEQSGKGLLDEKIQKSVSEKFNGITEKLPENKQTQVKDMEDDLEQMVVKVMKRILQPIIKERSNTFLDDDCRARSSLDEADLEDDGRTHDVQSTAPQKENVHEKSRREWTSFAETRTKSFSKESLDKENGSGNSSLWASWISYIFLIIYRLAFFACFCLSIFTIMNRGDEIIQACLAFILLSPCGLNPLALFDVCMSTRDENGEPYLYVNFLILVYRLIWFCGLVITFTPLLSELDSGFSIILFMPLFLFSGLNPFVFFT